MTSKTIRKRIIEYVNHADDDVVEAVYKILKIYQEGSTKSTLSTEQKTEVERRSNLYKAGKMKSYSLEEVKEYARKRK